MAHFLQELWKMDVMKKAYASLLLVVVNLMAFAQEKKTDIDVNINKHADTSTGMHPPGFGYWAQPYLLSCWWR